jgi:galactoside O-acetyltransferase
MKAEMYLSQSELSKLPFESIGRHVYVSRSAVITHPERLSIGDHVRIDDFTLITGSRQVNIGSNVHIGTSVTVNASAAVTIGDFSGLSAGVKLFTTDDDYGGEYLTGPTVPQHLSNITTQEVVIGRHCVVGANSVLLPGCNLENGVVVGALSLVRGWLPGWAIYGGVPVRLLRQRSQVLVQKAQQHAAHDQ